jgi:hypothetical protein
LQSEVNFGGAPKDERKETSTLVIANTYEFNRRHWKDTGRAPTRAQLYSQLSFALGGLPNNTPYILTHAEISRDLLSHWGQVLGYSPSILVCQAKTGRICLDTLENLNLLSRLRSLSLNISSLRPWGMTKEFDSLSRSIQSLDVTHLSVRGSTSALPSFLDAKAANRAFLDSLIHERRGRTFTQLPYAITPANSNEVIKSVRAMLSQWPTVIIKPGYTWGGRGTISVSRSDYQDGTVRALVENGMSEFSGGYFLIEPFVGTVESNLSPSFDWQPKQDGNAGGRIYGGRMLMETFNCRGTIYGRSALASAEVFRPTFNSVTRTFAESLGELGYQGWFDLDFLVSDKFTIISEMNLRHTGGTIPILIANRLLFDGWEKRFTCVALDTIRTRLSIPQIIDRAAHMGFVNDKTRKFVVTAHDVEKVDTDGYLVSFWLGSTKPRHVLESAFSLRHSIQRSDV